MTQVDFKDQVQFEWAAPAPRPSKIISRINFTTSTDLLALAKKKDYNVTFVVGRCAKGGAPMSFVKHYRRLWVGKWCRRAAWRTARRSD
ncbi:hypothetical protein, partial [Burkholderia pseudomallei]|uniref:hypothetical protein n=1 Tax=Burkholderia pseudomallei TaxID=28450 RepID=UPI0012B1700F